MPQRKTTSSAASNDAKTPPPDVANPQHHADGEIGLSITNVGSGLKVEVVPNTKERWSRLMPLYGTENEQFFRGLLAQLAGSGSRSGESDVKRIGFLLAAVEGIHPRDETEAMLAAQMAVVHRTAMGLAQSDNPEHIRLFAKLIKTFAELMEALKRYRTGGEQKVTVQYVSVADGGQAIVGPVTQAAPQTAPPKPEDKPKALTHSRQAAMPVLGRPAREPVAARRRQKNEG